MAINWREMIPHYVAMLALYAVLVIAVNVLFGLNSFLVQVAIAVVVAFTYPPIVRQLGYTPSSWER